MRIIATTPEENAVITDLAADLKEKGIYAELTKYEDGFGITIWSVDDLQSYSETHDWPQDEKIRFMEFAGHKLGGATEDSWEILRTLIEQFVENRKDTNTAYVDENYEEFDKTKFYLDVCGGGWVRMVYYNPDSYAGGQLVYDLLSDCVILGASKEHPTESEFWDYLYENAKQTLVDIDTADFADYAKEFAEVPCDRSVQDAETMHWLIKWANTSLNGSGGNTDGK